jgi:hypothetical protein
MASETIKKKNKKKTLEQIIAYLKGKKKNHGQP